MEEKTKKTTATAGVGNAVKIYFLHLASYQVMCYQFS